MPHVAIDHAVGPALGTRSVVRESDDQRVVEGVDAPEKVEQAADLKIGVLQEAGIDLHHPRVDGPLIRRAFVPRLDVRIVARQFGIGWDHAEFLLAGKDRLSVDVPAIVELPLVLVRPFLRHMMGCMHGPRAEVHEEGLVRIHLFGIGDEGNGLVDQVLSQVIALFRSLLRVNLVAVIDEFGTILVRVAA